MFTRISQSATTTFKVLTLRNQSSSGNDIRRSICINQDEILPTPPNNTHSRHAVNSHLKTLQIDTKTSVNIQTSNLRQITSIA